MSYINSQLKLEYTKKIKNYIINIKFAKIKRTLNPKDKRIKENQEKLKKKELALQKKEKVNSDIEIK